MKWNTIAVYALVFSPSILLTVGWVRWRQCRGSQHWRNFVIVWGMAAVSASALCLYGELLYVRLAHLSLANENRCAMAGVLAGLPLSVLATVAALIGKGRARVMLCLAAVCLVVVWMAAAFYAT